MDEITEEDRRFIADDDEEEDHSDRREKRKKEQFEDVESDLDEDDLDLLDENYGIDRQVFLNF